MALYHLARIEEREGNSDAAIARYREGRPPTKVRLWVIVWPNGTLDLRPYPGDPPYELDPAESSLRAFPDLEGEGYQFEIGTQPLGPPGANGTYLIGWPVG